MLVTVYDIPSTSKVSLTLSASALIVAGNNSATSTTIMCKCFCFILTIVLKELLNNHVCLGKTQKENVNDSQYVCICLTYTFFSYIRSPSVHKWTTGLRLQIYKEKSEPPSNSDNYFVIKQKSRNCKKPNSNIYMKKVRKG